MSGISNIPQPFNEPVLSYAPESAERSALKSALAAVGAERPEIPAVVGGREIRSGVTQNVVSPHCHGRVLATLHLADQATIDAAVRSAVEAQRDWAQWRFEDRAAVFLKAAELLATSARQRLNAATMLGQSKTAFQAEIDSACELIDFLRFNVHYAERIYQEQPGSAPGVWNRLDHRPLEGFVYAITPFNFTAIGGNLPTAPALMGNAVVWKPAHSAALSNWHFFTLLEQAGLPPGVINFLPGEAVGVSRALLASPDLAGVHFTGSTTVFQSLWKTIADHLERYRAYPRIVGETGGKDFILAHSSADADALAVAMVRGAYEYQGQKCSAASRAYIPDTLWPAVRDRVVGMIDDIRMGDVADFRNFMGAVIDDRAFTRLRDHLEQARRDPGVRIVAGGGTDDSVGWFVQPTLLQAEDPAYRLMCEEIFGPVLTVHIYPAARWTETLGLVDRTSPYALTGAVFSRDRAALADADRALRHAAGNYYINDKPTGAVVGQQPFGGARASGTNDKAGSILNLLRWVSPRSIKETFAPAKDYRYPFMLEA
ncbi:MAG TPA: L-glutamate gamma-semialdehyde dehydrogenase [Gemmatimonadales bacterium]|jgi:1-pyrroline-5-carboxylate dehydrogenase|nr:L-glutamate gamma-semialdehyde dehydrogenase [Gemmatimonadales bacterium]